jgi:hypothetical protein
VQDQFTPPNLLENVQLSGVTITETVNANKGTCGGNSVERLQLGARLSMMISESAIVVASLGAQVVKALRLRQSSQMAFRCETRI